MKAEKAKSGARTNREERDTRVELCRRYTTRGSTAALFSVWVVFSSFFWAVTSASANDRPSSPQPEETNTSYSPPFDGGLRKFPEESHAGNKAQQAESGGLFPGNGSGYSVIVEIEPSALHQDSNRPEVIYEIASYRPKYSSSSLAARLDFAFSEGLFPGWRVTDGLEYILDKEETLVDKRDLTEQDIEEMGPENGYLGLSLFVHRPLGRFSPYIWVRGGAQPIPAEEGLEPNAKYAVNARCGIPFRVTPHCALSVDAGYVLGFVQGLSGTVHVPTLTASLQVTF